MSPVGIGIENNWKALLEARSGIGEITLFDASDYPVRIAGEVTDFSGSNFFSNKELRKLDRYEQFAIVAARMAAEDAGLDRASLEGDRTGVLIGTGLGGLETFWDAVVTIRERGPKRVSPFTIPKKRSTRRCACVRRSRSACARSRSTISTFAAPPIR